MGAVELRDKLIQLINTADEKYLKVLYDFAEKKKKDQTDPYDELPDVAKKLIDQSLEDIKHGRVQTYKDVMAEFRKKYNLA